MFLVQGLKVYDKICTPLVNRPFYGTFFSVFFLINFPRFIK